MATNETKHEVLLWSEQGALACRRHAPTEGSDTWRSGRWRELTRAEAVEFEEELGHPPACESCEDARRTTAEEHAS